MDQSSTLGILFVGFTQASLWRNESFDSGPSLVFSCTGTPFSERIWWQHYRENVTVPVWRLSLLWSQKIDFGQTCAIAFTEAVTLSFALYFCTTSSSHCGNMGIQCKTFAIML